MVAVCYGFQLELDWSAEVSENEHLTHRARQLHHTLRNLIHLFRTTHTRAGVVIVSTKAVTNVHGVV